MTSIDDLFVTTGFAVGAITFYRTATRRDVRRLDKALARLAATVAFVNFIMSAVRFARDVTSALLS